MTHFYQTKTDENLETILIKDGATLFKIHINDILFLKSDGNYLEIFTTAQRIVLKQSMISFCKKLPKEIFRKIHKSYVVNSNRVSLYTGKFVQINKNRIPVGRSFRKLLMNNLRYRFLN